MMERIKEKARIAWHWLIAGIIATSIASAGVSLLYFRYDKPNNKHLQSENRPCEERACFAQMNTRVAAFEAEMLARTANRYTSQDAERDHRTMQLQLNKYRTEINELRSRLDRYDRS